MGRLQKKRRKTGKNGWKMTISKDGERAKKERKKARKQHKRKKRHTRDQTNLKGKARPAQ